MPFGCTIRSSPAASRQRDPGDKLRDADPRARRPPRAVPQIFLRQFCADYYHHPLGAISWRCCRRGCERHPICRRDALAGGDELGARQSRSPRRGAARAARHGAGAPSLARARTEQAMRRRWWPPAGRNGHVSTPSGRTPQTPLPAATVEHRPRLTRSCPRSGNSVCIWSTASPAAARPSCTCG
jgi:hypothetical protein